MGLGIILFKNLNFKGGAKWKGLQVSAAYVTWANSWNFNYPAYSAQLLGL